MRGLSLVFLCLAGAAKKMKVGTTAAYPPMESRDPKTNELMLEWQNTSLAQLTPSAASGRVDVVMSARSNETYFSRPR